MAHRLLICAGLSEGKSVIEGISSSEDMKATLDCLSAIGAKTFKTEIFGKDSEVSENEILIKAGESYLFECEMK